MEPSSSILGVCSWSLRPSGPKDLAEKVRATGLKWVQLHLDPIRTGEWSYDETVAALKEAGIGIASGMISMKGEDYSTLQSIRRTGGVAPDDTWDENLQAAVGNTALAYRMGLKLVTFHAGFLPHDKNDPAWERLVSRIATLAVMFDGVGSRIALETGQEQAGTLMDVLAAVRARAPRAAPVGVNFDPANIVLYGMGDPARAAQLLAPHIVQVHVKDAIPTTTPGTWGTEVPPGQGAVGWPKFLDVFRESGVRCPIIIEREAGEARVEDVAAAARMIESAGGLA